MSLQIFSGTSRVLLDTTDRLSRLHGRYTVSAAWDVQSGFISVPGMVDDNSWYCFVSSSVAGGGYSQPIFMQIANGGFNWMRWDAAGAINEIVTVMRV